MYDLSEIVTACFYGGTIKLNGNNLDVVYILFNFISYSIKPIRLSFLFFFTFCGSEESFE